MCGGEDRFRYIDKKGDGWWICNGCGSGGGIELVKRWRQIEFKEAAKLVESVVGSAKEHKLRKQDETKRRRIMQEMWDRGVTITPGDPVSLYLRKRGLEDVELSPSAVRYIESRQYEDSDQYFPCMIAKVVAANHHPVTLHQTYLTADGEKAPVEKPRKLFWGNHPDGSAVRLMMPETGVLGIAEGIETAIAASKLWHLPVWAALNAHHLAKWRPPKGIRQVHVFGDADAKFAGQAAAYECGRGVYCMAENLRPEEVIVRIPDAVGRDWNDVLSPHLNPG